MKCVYEAENTLDAHVVVDLLSQSEINGHVDGKYLQGGIGEIPVSGLVRVMVNDSDYEKARSIVKEWDVKEIEEKNVTNKPFNNMVASLFIGAFLGSAIVWWLHNSPVYEDGIDHNRDGVIDEKWIGSGTKFSRVEVDRNFDNKVDLIHEYDRKGLIATSSLDDDFNGSFESKVKYQKGQPVIEESDTNDDGFADLRTKYKNGVLFQIEFLNPETKWIVKRVHFISKKQVSAEFDSDNNGTLETKYKYDVYENVIESVVNE